MFFYFYPVEYSICPYREFQKKIKMREYLEYTPTDEELFQWADENMKTQGFFQWMIRLPIYKEDKNFLTGFKDICVLAYENSRLKFKIDPVDPKEFLSDYLKRNIVWCKTIQNLPDHKNFILNEVNRKFPNATMNEFRKFKKLFILFHYTLSLFENCMGWGIPSERYIQEYPKLFADYHPFTPLATELIKKETILMLYHDIIQ
jgi:hypothetical protein